MALKLCHTTGRKNNDKEWHDKMIQYKTLQQQSGICLRKDVTSVVGFEYEDVIDVCDSTIRSLFNRFSTKTLIHNEWNTWRKVTMFKRTAGTFRCSQFFYLWYQRVALQTKVDRSSGPSHSRRYTFRSVCARTLGWIPGRRKGAPGPRSRLWLKTQARR